MAKEYTVWRETDKESFEIAVEEYLRNGWDLAGGVSISLLPSKHLEGIYTVLYAQAFTRERKLDEQS